MAKKAKKRTAKKKLVRKKSARKPVCAKVKPKSVKAPKKNAKRKKAQKRSTKSKGSQTLSKRIVNSKSSIVNPPTPPAGYDENTAQAKRMARARAKARDIVIDFSRQDMKRRQRGRRNPAFFLRTYFPHIFWRAFSRDQKHNIKEIAHRMRHGGFKAIAAPRGEGKTSIVKGMVIWGLCYGIINWVPWIEANLDLAMESLEDIRLTFEEAVGGVGEDLFGADFPEYCTPIRALEGEAQRARRQTYAKKRTRIGWGIKRIILPTVAASATPNDTGAFGGIVQAFGAEKAIRGLVRQGRRPDIVVLNDIETEDSARSMTQTTNIKKNITKAVLGLGGPGAKFGAVYLCTIIRKGCVADQFTDRKKYPQWAGERQKMLDSLPTAADMWEHYIYLRQSEQRKGVAVCRQADKYYRKNRKVMDAGCRPSNPERYDSSNAADGKPAEISAVQHAYNLISDRGKEYFLCECQNEPTEEIADAAQVDKTVIEAKVNGFERGTIPPGCEKLIVFVDVHDTRLFWKAVAWKPGLTGYVIDYGAERVFSPLGGTVTANEKKKQVEIAITEAIVAFIKKINVRGGWPIGDTGEMMAVNIGLVDAGYKQDAVYAACRRFAGGIWRPSRGGSGSTKSPRYRTPKPSPTVKGIGAGFHRSYQAKDRIWLTFFDPNKYKQRCQDGFLTPAVDAPGSISLFGDDPAAHRAFAEHIAAEAWSESKDRYDTVDGARENHWLDCGAGCCAGAEIVGLRLQGAPVTKSKKKKRYRRMVDAPQYRT